MSRLNLLDIAERNGDAVVGLIEEVLISAPELEVIPMRTRKGTTYRITKRTGLPTVGFRDANQGVVPSKSTYKSEARPMFFFDAQLEVDEAVVKADEGQLGDVLADESSGVMQAMGIKMGTQIYNGKNADAKGFLGLKDQIAAGANFTFDATGTGTIDTAWLVWLDPNHKGVELVIGEDGKMELGDWAKQQVTDTQDATRKYMAWVNNMSFYIGLSVHSDASVWRIKNINVAHPLTDALGAELLSKVPVARRANLHWFMNRTTAFLLQNSRAAANAYIGKVYAEQPESLAGIPITITDSVVAEAAY